MKELEENKTYQKLKSAHEIQNILSINFIAIILFMSFLYPIGKLGTFLFISFIYGVSVYILFSNLFLKQIVSVKSGKIIEIKNKENEKEKYIATIKTEDNELYEASFLSIEENKENKKEKNGFYITLKNNTDLIIS